MRSKYIYLIYQKGWGPYSLAPHLLSAHTVKHEAHTWIKRSNWAPDTAELWRALDGLSGLPDGKSVKRIEWDLKLLEAKGFTGHLEKCASEVEDWPEWGRNL